MFEIFIVVTIIIVMTIIGAFYKMIADAMEESIESEKENEDE